MGEFLTENQLSEWLKISRSTIVRLRKGGMPFTKIGKAVRYDKDKVQEWLDKKKSKLKRNPVYLGQYSLDSFYTKQTLLKAASCIL